MKKQLAVILALSATLGVSTIIPQTAPQKVEAASAQTITPYQQKEQAIEHLNEIRKAAGLRPVTTDLSLE